MNTQTLKNLIDAQGYALYKKALPPSLVERLIRATDQTLLEPRYQNDLLKLNNTHHVHKVLYRVEKENTFLEALVSPSIFEILSALHIQSDRIVPTWEDMLIKIPLNGIQVDVHQDLALHSMNQPVFSLGVYLHSSEANPVYYLPESHLRGPLTRTEIQELFLQRKQDFLPVYAEPGDILIHNVKTVHYSEENKSPSPRYTRYLEFRTQDQLENDSPWDEDWIGARRSIWAHAIHTYVPQMSHWIPENEDLNKYLTPLRLRVSHTNDHIKYDQTNPYNHFAGT